MISQTNKNENRHKVHRRIRRRISGSSDRPRMCVFRSLKHFYAQIIDDVEGRVIVSASTNDKSLRSQMVKGGNIAAAKEIGKIMAERAQTEGIKLVVMDRGGYLYHGRVQAFAEATRKAGLKF